MHRRLPLLPIVLTTFALWTGCETPPPQRAPLPPSESDLDLLKSTKLCDSRQVFLEKHPGTAPQTQAWGSGQEIRIPAEQSPSKGEESYFFDEDGTLVGTLFLFRSGLDLGPYKTLRYTLSRLKPSLEFYLTVAELADRQNMAFSTLYDTGDEKTTTRYLVLSDPATPRLLAASFTIDPYVKLFSPYRKEFLERLRETTPQGGGQHLDTQGADDKEPFASLQQFARGQTAQLAYCGTKNQPLALDAYQKASASGFTSPLWQAELHHRLGVSWEAAGNLEKAKRELLASLAKRPNSPEVVNNLGHVYSTLGEKQNALASFEKAVLMRPNYAIARFNLAEAVADSNPKRAITEYETYLALTEGIPEEADRSAVAQNRVKALQHQ